MTSRALFRVERILSDGESVGPVLGLETGSPIASVGLVAGGRLLGHISRAVESHGKKLPALVDELLESAALRLEQLTAVAVGIGPGSFTGLRIGLAYAKGLAWSGGLPILGINSLDAMALGASRHPIARPDAVICPILDARKGEVYAALYRATATAVEKISDDMIVDPGHLTARIGGEAIFVGEGVSVHGARLTDAMGKRASILDNDEHSDSRGMMVAALGVARIASGDVDSVLSLQPSYVRSLEAALGGQAAARLETAGMEAVWSKEKRSLSSSTLLPTRS
ncbi:MAG TPA: tRNA (adenosine(37)-N6)-threonylcarbamoyltransferase complex dimerization subunit type 1 TsaB [Candidatus Binataceae bacterium]|nr:tRNA (adenosine(37)-N6)-threonylcarbamoyltransferase complex dimerization subunit type 1 TsaB [Candidatus Binataceae bacterium]